jgi:hypothetical protein
MARKRRSRQLRLYYRKLTASWGVKLHVSSTARWAVRRLEAESGLHLDGAGTQRVLRLAKMRVQDVNLRVV